MLRTYYFNHLDVSEQEKYERLLKNTLRQKNPTILSSPITEEATLAMLYEHPELFFCNLRRIDYFTNPFGVMTNIDYCISEDRKNAVLYQFQSMSQSLPNGKTEAVIRYIHNYLVKNIKYDYESGQSMMYEHTGHTVIGPLINGQGVCEGISLLFKWILDSKGVDNTVVVGQYGDVQGIYHMWNVVSIQGRNYYIDITQDIASTNNAWGKPSYLFYLLTETEIRQDHAFEEKFGCNNTIDNPFYKAGRVFSNVLSLEQFARSIPASQRLINFMYTGPESQETITNIVKRAIPKNPLFPRMSTTKNYGRYYFYKEV